MPTLRSRNYEDIFEEAKGGFWVLTDGTFVAVRQEYKHTTTLYDILLEEGGWCEGHRFAFYSDGFERGYVRITASGPSIGVQHSHAAARRALQAARKVLSRYDRAGDFWWEVDGDARAEGVYHHARDARELQRLVAPIVAEAVL